MNTFARIVAVGTILAAAVLPAHVDAQAPGNGDANRPAFDATSVKLNKSGSGNVGINTQPGGRFVASNATVEMLITMAYQLKPHQLVGGPEWMDSEHFDIEARAAINPNRDQMALMMQSLLADRFKLVAHHEMRPIPFYALVPVKAGKMGPQLLMHSDDTRCPEPTGGPPPPGPRPTPCGGFFVSNGHVAAAKITMEMLSRTLSVFVDRVVLDRTGLSRDFDVDFTFSGQQSLFGGQRGGPDTSSPDPSGPPSLFTALQEQLGLKLEAQTGPVDVLVIDHVEQPSEN